MQSVAMGTTKDANRHAGGVQDQGARYGAGRRSPLGLGGTVAVHALVVAIFLLLPKEVVEHFNPQPPIITYEVPDDPPPPVVPVEPEVDARLPTKPAPDRPTAVDPLAHLPPSGTDLSTSDKAGDILVPTPPYMPPPLPAPDPIVTDPAIDPRALSTFQPDYPGAMIRQQVEGKVTVRVAISAEGRVTAVEKLSATDDSFWLATQRHALRKWRFRPATRDGVAVASTKVLTVRFTLTDQ